MEVDNDNASDDEQIKECKRRMAGELRDEIVKHRYDHIYNWLFIAFTQFLKRCKFEFNQRLVNNLLFPSSIGSVSGFNRQ